MITLGQFIEQVNINLTNLFQNLDAVTYCATHEGAYCDEFYGLGEDGKKNLGAIPFLPTEAPAWDKIQVNEQYLSQEEFTDLVLDAIVDLINHGALDSEEILEELNSYRDGLGI